MTASDFWRDMTSSLQVGVIEFNPLSTIFFYIFTYLVTYFFDELLIFFKLTVNTSV